MEGAASIRVMIVDDHPMVRQGLRAFLSTCDDIDVVGEAGSGLEAVNAVGRLTPEVVLMDMVMPIMDGATATGHIMAEHPGVRVIALTSFVEADTVKRVLEAGAISYLLKDASPDKLADAIRQAYRGRGTIDSSAAQALMASRVAARDTFGEELTSREREVLVLLAKGMSNRDIAGKLYLSQGTVRLHVSNVLRKLEAPNRTAAAMMAMQHGLAQGSAA